MDANKTIRQSTSRTEADELVGGEGQVVETVILSQLKHSSVHQTTKKTLDSV